MKRLLGIIVLSSELFLLHPNVYAFECKWDGKSNFQKCNYDYLTFDSNDGSRKIINYALSPGKANAKLYYQSTGENSGYKDTVFPFYGLDENKVFIKPYLGRNISAEFENNFIKEISDKRLRDLFINDLNKVAIRIYGASNNWKDLIEKSKPLKTLIQRLYSLEDAEFSHEFSSPLWEENTDDDDINGFIHALNSLFKTLDSKKINVIGGWKTQLGKYNMNNLSADQLNNKLYDFTS